VAEVKNLLNHKTHISKITLRKAAILFQILEISYRRVVHLAAATSHVGHDDENSIKAVWQLLSQAQKHHQILVKTLFDLTGIPVTLNLTGTEEAFAHDFGGILQKENARQQETLKLLEKAIEVFGEDQELAAQLSLMRKELLDTKKRMKHIGSSGPVERGEFLKPASTKLEMPSDTSAVKS
jgi:hypothetical protein